MSRRPLVLLALAVGTALGAVAVWLVALGVPRGRGWDATAMQSFVGAARPPLQPSIMGVAHLADPAPLLIGGILLVAVALLRRRPLMALLVPLILGGANLTTQLLKPALGDLRVIDLYGTAMVYHGSWPSGHATAAMSLALCAVLVVGPALRPLTALLGAGYAIAVGYALVSLGWHLPSDVVGGFLVAATFTLLGAAALAALEAPSPERLPAFSRPSAPEVVPVAAVLAGVAVVIVMAGLAAIVRAPETAIDALGHTSAIAAGLGIGLIGLSLTAGLALALRR